MKRISIVGLFLAAVFALSAGIASSASAAELLARVAGGGSVAGVTFLSLGGLSLLTTDKPGLHLVHCKEVHDHGLWLSSTLGDVLIFFLGCTTVVASTIPCTSPGAPEGDIHLPLATTLFHLGLAHLELSGGSFDRVPALAILLTKDVLFECPPFVHALVLGAVIGALQLDEPKERPIPLNEPFSTALLNFQQTAHGLQHLRLFLLPGSGLVSYDLDTSINGGAAELSAEVSLDLLDLFRLSNGTHVSLELVEP